MCSQPCVSHAAQTENNSDNAGGEAAALLIKKKACFSPLPLD